MDRRQQCAISLLAILSMIAEREICTYYIQTLSAKRIHMSVPSCRGGRFKVKEKERELVAGA
jgi:hypothetical protein